MNVKLVVPELPSDAVTLFTLTDGVPPITCTIAADVDWPSGFVIVSVYFSEPMFAVALVVLSTRFTVVGFTYVADTTVGGVPVAAPFVMDAVRWLNAGTPGRFAPGSKKPEPDTCVPESTTFTVAWPALTSASVVGVAGGGAMSLVTRTP